MEKSWNFFFNLKKFLKKVEKKVEKNPHLSCDLLKIGANIYSKLAVPPFLCKKYGPGWMGGWGVEPGLGLL